MTPLLKAEYESSKKGLSAKQVKIEHLEGKVRELEFLLSANIDSTRQVESLRD